MAGILLGVCASAAPVYKGKIISESALIYEKPDFDAKNLGQVSGGKVFEISKKTFGAFHRIRVGQSIGYIADTDVKPLNFKREAEESDDQNLKKKKQARVKKKRSFEMTRYFGLSYSSTQFTEETLGSKRRENIGFFGLKMSGPNVVLQGDIPTEFNLEFHSGAPSYYENLTGQSAAGFLFRMDLQFQSVWTLAPTVLSYVGFGPLFRYSRFDVGLLDPSTAKVTSYSAEDMTFGAAFSLGFAARLGPFAVRPEIKYYWEKFQYFGFGVALQYEF